MPAKKFFLMYAISILIIYLILVIDGIFWSMYQGEAGGAALSFAKIASWQDFFTSVALGLFITLVLRNRIIRDFIYPFGMFTSYLVLSINKILWDLEVRWYESMLSVLLFEQNWLAMLVGAFIFLFYYRRFKRMRI